MGHEFKITQREIDFVRAISRRLLRDPADVDDAVQDALVRALRFQNDYDGTVKLTTWLYVLAHNSAIDVMRRNSALNRARAAVFDQVISDESVALPADDRSLKADRQVVREMRDAETRCLRSSAYCW